MGLITPGIPEDITLRLAKLANASVFVETGTFKGRTARWAARHFDRVITIEGSERLYSEHSVTLKAIRNVEPHLGDSRTILSALAKSIGPAVFWLDAHWSSGETFGHADECPLMAELTAISHRIGDVVLIDDARLFLHAPPEPHDPDQWPSIVDIVHALDAWAEPPVIQIINDVIFAVPRALRGVLVEHARNYDAKAFRAARLLARLR
jgi:hypothetical protein